MNDSDQKTPSAYFLTFRTYGSKFHGSKGAVDRFHNVFGTDYPEASKTLEKAKEGSLKQAPYLLKTHFHRKIVLSSIIKTCSVFDWHLYAAHVRTNHVHVVLWSNEKAERILNKIKAYASRALNESDIDHGKVKRWSRHGSTRYLWGSKFINAAMRYVVEDQGKVMGLFYDEKNYDPKMIFEELE